MHRAVASLLLASPAAAFNTGLHVQGGVRARGLSPVMQDGPLEHGAWDFRHGPGHVADSDRWGTPGGPGQWVQRRGRVYAPPIESGHVISASSTPAVSGAAPTSAITASPNTDAEPLAEDEPLEKENAWNFRHGPGRLEPLSSGGP
jgi:hypothetical protein